MFVTEVFARYAMAYREQPLSEPVLHHAKRAVIDWYASLFPGLSTESVRVLERTLAEDLDHGLARLALGRPATARASALINGTAAHAAEVDDSFREAMYHPGAATVAAALAAAQLVRADGLQFLRAVVLGYEVSTRIGVAMGRAHYKFWHSTGTVGTFGATAAAASLLQLNETQFAHALATAGTFAAGLQQAFRKETTSKPLHAGRAAEAGLLAAQLACNGMRSTLDVFEAEAGLGQAMSAGPDWSQIGATLGLDFHITRLTFKNHIGCGHTFPAIDGALELQRLHGFGHQDIEQVHVSTYKPALDIASHVQPSTADEARFSLNYVVATALVHGSVRLSAYERDRLEDPATLDLMRRVEAVVDPMLDAAFPGRRSARVEIVLRDGRRLTHLQPDRKGDPELPLSDEELGSKLIELAAPTLGAASAQALLARLWTLDRSESLT